VVHAAALVLTCALTLLPWTLRNYRVHGGLTPMTASATDLARLATDDVNQRGLTETLVHRALDDPAGFGRRLAVEFGHFWELVPSRLATDDPARRQEMHEGDPRLPPEPFVAQTLRDSVSALSFGLELLLGFLGVALLWRRRRRETALLLAIVVTFALGYSLFFGKLRYRVPVLPLVFVFTAVGAAAAIERFRFAWKRQA
jgi:hypothetical protein